MGSWQVSNPSLTTGSKTGAPPPSLLPGILWEDRTLMPLIFKNIYRTGKILACEQAPSEVGKQFGERSEFELELRDSASEASALPPHQTALGSSRSP